jgi:hypothetical protein
MEEKPFLLNKMKKLNTKEKQIGEKAMHTKSAN